MNYSDIKKLRTESVSQKYILKLKSKNNRGIKIQQYILRSVKHFIVSAKIMVGHSFFLFKRRENS